MAAKLILQNQNGFATIEAASLMIVFTVLVSFTLGSFGIIHTAILQSIASRNYSFEIFRHRTNLNYLRDAQGDGISTPDVIAYGGITGAPNFRIQFVVSETTASGNSYFEPSERSIAMAHTVQVQGRDSASHEKILSDPQLAEGQRYNTSAGLSPIWIQVQYGICLTAGCN